MNASGRGRGEMVSSGFGQVTVLFGGYRSGDGEDLSRDRSTRGQARRRRSMGGAVSRVLESLEKRTLMAAQQLTPSTADFAFAPANNVSYSSAVVAVSPSDPRVRATLAVRTSVSGGVTSMSVVGDVGLGNTTFIDPATANATSTGTGYAVVTDLSAQFDRANNLYVTYLNRSTDGQRGAVALQKYTVQPDGTFERQDLDPVTTGVQGLVLYRWDGEVDAFGGAGTTDAAISPTLAVNQNVATYTDPLTNLVLTDPTFVDGVAPVYVAWGTVSSRPDSVTTASWNPNVIMVRGSTDGGLSFTPPRLWNDDGPVSPSMLGAYIGTDRSGTPKLVVSQGAWDRTDPANPVLKVQPGQLSVVWVDSNFQAAITGVQPARDGINLTRTDSALPVRSTGAWLTAIGPIDQRGPAVAGVLPPVAVTDFPLDTVTLPSGMTDANIDSIQFEVAIGGVGLDLSGIELRLIAPDGTNFIQLVQSGKDDQADAISPVQGITGNLLGARDRGTGNTAARLLAAGTTFTDSATRFADESVNDSGDRYIGFYRASALGGGAESFADLIDVIKTAGGTFAGTWTLRVINNNAANLPAGQAAAGFVRAARISIGQGMLPEQNPDGDQVINAVGTTRTLSNPVNSPNSARSFVETTADFPNSGVMDATAGKGAGPGVVVASDNTLGDRFRNSTVVNNVTVSYTAQGRIYLAFVDRQRSETNDATNEADNTDVFLVTSDDGGATWSGAQRINDDDTLTDGFSSAWNDGTRSSADPGAQRFGRSQFMPALSVDPTNGNVAMSWLDGRWDPARTKTTTYLAVSTDGGLSFLPQTFMNNRLTVTDPTKPIGQQTVTLGPVPDNFGTANTTPGQRFVEASQATGLGDSIGLAAMNGQVFAAWIGNENGSSGTNEREVLTNTVSVPGGPQIVSSDMGAVTTGGSEVSTDAAGVVSTVTYNGTFSASGVRQFDGFVLEFDRYVRAGSLTAADVKVLYRNTSTAGTSPGTNVAVASITPLFDDRNAATDQAAKRFLVRLTTPQSAVGTYSYTVAPSARDTVNFYGLGNFKATQTQFVSSPVTIAAGTDAGGGVVTPGVTTITFNVDSTLIPTILSAPEVFNARAQFSLNFPDLSQINVDLTSPDGTTVRLLTGRELGAARLSGTSMLGTRLSDDATAALPTAAPYGGHYLPAGLTAAPFPIDGGFGDFIGLPANGTWTLTITNNSLLGGASAGTNAQVGSFVLSLQSTELVNTGPLVEGNQTDQDGDGFGGLATEENWTVGDVYAIPGPRDAVLNSDKSYVPGGGLTTLPIVVPGPFVVSSVPTLGTTAITGSVALNTAVTGVRLTFDRDMATLTQQQLRDLILGVTGPTGNLVGPQRYTAADKNVAIPDRQTPRRVLQSSLAIADSYPIGDINVQLSITHPRVGDLVLSLVSPPNAQGVRTTIPLAANVGGTGANFTNTIFDDQATTAIGSGTAPFQQVAGYSPATPLSGLNLRDAKGIWTLQVEDTVTGSVGTLNYWSMVVTPDRSAVTVTQESARVMRVDFPTQTASGTYAVTLSSQLTSAAGERLDSNVNAGVEVLGLTAPASFNGPSGRVLAAGTSVSQNYTSAQVPIVIAPSGTTTQLSTLTVTDSFSIAEAQVRINSLSHINVQDLLIELVGPDGTVVQLFNGNGQAGSYGSDDNFQQTLFSTLEAQQPDPTGGTNLPPRKVATSIQSGRASFLGTFRPDDATGGLDKLVGKASAGVYTLRITNRGTTSGVLSDWGLVLRRATPGTGLGERGIDDATVTFRTHNFAPTDIASTNNWVAMGPFSSQTAGRVSSIVFDPSDASKNTAYAAGASGGVWVTRNFLDPSGEPTWIPLTDFGGARSLNVSSLAVFGRSNDVSQSILFAGTGEPEANRDGVGFLRSVDGGRSWTLLDSTRNFDAQGNPLPASQRDFTFVGAQVYRVVVDPSPTPAGETIVYAAVGGTANASGVWRSTDSGRNWTRVLNVGNAEATDVSLDLNSTTFDATTNPTANVQGVYAAIAGNGVYYSPSRGGQWQLMSGNVLGKPTFVDPTVPQTSQLQVTAPQDRPNGAKARITLARPALTGDARRDLLLQGWMYALVSDPATSTTLSLDGVTPTKYDGLYVTKDNGANWTRIALSTEAVTVVNNTEYLPTNEVTGTEPRIFSRPVGSTTGASFEIPMGDEAQGLAVDPLNPMIVYVGGSRMLRVDTTGVWDASAFFISPFDGSGLLTPQATQAAAGPAIPRTNPVTAADNPSALDPLNNPFINLTRSPTDPYNDDARVLVNNVARLVNTGAGAKWTYFAEDAYGAARGVQDLVTMVDPVTGRTRVVIGMDQGVFTRMDDGTGGDVDSISDRPIAKGSRNGNLQVAQLVQGAAQPVLASQLSSAESFFIASGRTTGGMFSGSDPVNSGTLSWTGSVGGAFGLGISQQRDQSGQLYTYQFFWPINGFDDNTSAFVTNGVGVRFVQVNGVGRTQGLIQSVTGFPAVTGDTQWGNIGQSVITVNPVNLSNAVVASSTGRLYSTIDRGLTWNLIANPDEIGLSGAVRAEAVTAIAFGAPQPAGTGGVDANNFMAYVGNGDGEVFVTFTGGGGGASVGTQAWFNISAGLDGTDIKQITTNPARGSYDAYAVTERGVYYMPDSRAANAAWVNVTGNLGTLLTNVFGDPNRTTSSLPLDAQGRINGLRTMIADWRYRIPTDPTDPLNSPTHPVLYAAGVGGVFRSLDRGVTWASFPNVSDDAARVDGGGLPNVEVADLDLSLGQIDPTTGFADSQGENLLMATTYGRGVFAIRVPPIVIPQTLAAGSTGTLSADKRTYVANVANPVFTGRTAANAFGNVVTVRLVNLDTNAVIATSGVGVNPAVDSFGNFSLAVPAGTFTTDGNYNIGFQAVDARGIASAPFRMIFTLDTTAPAAPRVLGLDPASDTGRFNNDRVTRDNTPTVLGDLGEAQALITLFATNTQSGAVVTLGTGPAANLGDWALTPANALPDGTYVLRATQTDLAGNLSQLSTGVSLEVRTVVPAAPAVPSLDPASDTGRSSTDGITADNTPTVRGTALPNAQVTVRRNGVDVATVDADANGNWNHTFATLADATYSVTAVQIDLAGNTSPASAALSMRILTATPATPTAPRVLAADDSGISSTDGVTNVRAPRITGSVLGQSSVLVFLGASATPLTSIIAANNGTYTLPLPSDLSDGTYGLTIRQVDPAGNTSAASGSLTLVIDGTAPTIFPTGITGTKNQLFSGVVAEFSDANPLGTSAITWGDGNSSAGSISSTQLPNGRNTVSGSNTFVRSGVFNYNVAVTDVAGNAASATGQATVTGQPVVLVAGRTLQFTEATLSGSQIVATFTDPSGVEPIESYAATINWGDGTTTDTAASTNPATIAFNPGTGVFTVTGLHRYGEDGSYTVTVTVTTGGVNTATGTSTAVVTQQAVTPTPATIQTTAGVQFSGVVATFLDAGDNPQPGDFTGTIDWGNGTTTAITQIVRDANNPKLFQAFGTITYTETLAQPYNVTVTILNKGIVPATVVSTATVANVPPTGAITGQTTVFAGSPASFRITAGDISSTDVTTGFRYSIDWGDNTAPTVIDPTANNGVAPGVLATKTYAASGNFTITVTITDRNGASSTATLPVAVAPTPTIGSFTVNDRAGGAGTLVPTLTSLGFTISAGGFVLPSMTLANLVLVRNAGEVRPLTGAGFTFNTTTGVGRLDVTSLNLPDGDYELRVNVPNGPTLVQLASVLRGDLNTDGVVDRKDQTLLRGVIGVNPGQPGYLEGSDVNGDGLVNNDDLTALRALNGRRLATVASTFIYNPRRVPKINPVSFGTARVGQSLARDVIIRNTDPTRALVLSNLGFSGNSQFTFAVVGQAAGTREVSIPAGGEIRLRFYITPTTVGSKFQASATFGIAFPNTTPQFVSVLATARVR